MIPRRPIISSRYDVAPAHRPVASSYENRFDVAPNTDFGFGATSKRFPKDAVLEKSPMVIEKMSG